MRRGFWYGMVLGGLAVVGLAVALAPRRAAPVSRLVRVRRRFGQGARRVLNRPVLRAGAAMARRLAR